MPEFNRFIMKIALIGYGKMGKEIEKIALSRGHEIVSVIDIDNRQDMDSDAFRSADVAIEFTAPAVAYGNCMEAFRQGVKVVSGSTGWMGEHGEEMRRLCKEEGKTLFWSSNFSLGVAVFSAVNKYLAKIMNRFPNYDVSMEETHHVHKLDAPSGTAVMLFDEIKTVRPNATAVYGRSGHGKRHFDDIGIHAIRMGNVVGEHEVILATPTQTISLKHEAHDRALFAEGAIVAASFLYKMDKGLYNMHDIMKD